MTACTQPGCTGTIVDDYCDVCGSPAGAAPFIPAGAAASAPSAALAGGPGLTAGRQRPEVPPAPRNGRLMTACTQPGCTGTIVDDYCDVCGSPAGAPPFIPAGAAARQPNLAEEERPIQPIPRVQMATAPSSTQDTAAPASTDPGAPGIEKVDEEKVDPAAAHQELSMALGVSPSILDMELMIASIRSGTGKVDAEKADPVAADTEQVDTEIAAPTATQPVDTEQADSTAADTKKTEAAPPGPDNPDTVETPPVGAVLSGGRQPLPQLPEQQVLAPVPVQTPVDKKRFGFLALAAAVLAALLIGALLFASRDGSGVTAQSVATVTATVTLPVSKSPSERSDESTDTGQRRADHSVGGFSRLCQALRSRSNPRYVPRWSWHLSAGAALGGGQVAGFPVTYEDRPVGPVHYPGRVWAAGSLLASRAGPGLRRGVENLCGSDQGLTAPGSGSLLSCA